MSSEKIGENILGYDPIGSIRMSDKKRKELELRVKAELAKKKEEQKETEGEKLPKLNVPGENPEEPTPGEPGWDKLVHINEHYRGRPKKTVKDEKTIKPA